MKRRVNEGFNQLLSEKALKAQVSHWLLIQGLAMLSELARLRGIPYEQMTAASRSLFSDLFKLGKEEVEEYGRTFSGLRNESALFTYLGKIRSLPGTERSAMEKTYSDFIRTALSPNQKSFYELRYNHQSSPHLTHVFGECKTLQELWMQGEEQDLKQFIDQHNIVARPFDGNYRDYFYDKIFQHRHLDPKEYADLKRYFETKNAKEQNDIKLALETMANEQKERVEKNATENGMYNHRNEKIRREYVRIKVQLSLIRLVETPIGDKRAQLTLLRTISKELKTSHQWVELLNDLRMLIKELTTRTDQRKLALEGWKIRDTHHFWDLFMAGTDVEGSCQRIDGNPSLNKCLLAYVLDGKNRMLTILNETGTPIARAIFRILLDKTTGSPVLFMEAIYPAFLSPLLQAALKRFAQLRAQVLNLPLISSEGMEESYKYQNEVQSLGSIAPWEYVDAIHNASRGGEFTIPTAQTLFTPQAEVRQVLKQAFSSADDATPVAAILDYCAPNKKEHEQSLQLAWNRLRQNTSATTTRTTTAATGTGPGSACVAATAIGSAAAPAAEGIDGGVNARRVV